MYQRYRLGLLRSITVVHSGLRVRGVQLGRRLRVMTRECLRVMNVTRYVWE